MQLRRILPTRGFVLVALAAVAVVLAVSWPTGRDGASADESVPLMSLSIYGPGVYCDGVLTEEKTSAKPEKCIVLISDVGFPDNVFSGLFTLSVEVNKLPPESWAPVAEEGVAGVGASDGTCDDNVDNDNANGADADDPTCNFPHYIGFGTQIDYGNLVYKPLDPEVGEFPGGNEVVWPDKHNLLSTRFPVWPTGTEGIVEHASTSGTQPFPVSTFTGNVVEIDFNCTASQSVTNVRLVPHEDPDNLTGTVLRDSTSQDPIPASASLLINCRQWDTDGDGCADKSEKQDKADANTGGGRNWNWYWDFFDTPDIDNVRDRAVNVPDIMRVAAKFGANDAGAAGTTADPDRNTPPLTVLSEADGGPGPGDYHPAFDRSGVPSPNPWNLGFPDGGPINIPDIMQVAAQFGHNCLF